MIGRTPKILVGAGLLALTLATTGGVQAAGEVVVSASPSDVRVGEPVEVLVRTFLVVDRGELAMALEAPLEPYPVPSGVWDVLYPWTDYPFDIVAQHLDGTQVRVTLARDSSDSTLWRGFVSLPKAGVWKVWVRNFPEEEPGATAEVRAEAASAASIEPGAAALTGALVGLLCGLALPRLRRRSRAG